MRILFIVTVALAGCATAPRRDYAKATPNERTIDRARDRAMTEPPREPNFQRELENNTSPQSGITK